MQLIQPNYACSFKVQKSLSNNPVNKLGNAEYWKVHETYRIHSLPRKLNVWPFMCRESPFRANYADLETWSFNLCRESWYYWRNLCCCVDSETYVSSTYAVRTPFLKSEGSQRPEESCWWSNLLGSGSGLTKKPFDCRMGDLTGNL